MATRLNPYLSFDGNAREAMDYYHGVFGGTLARSTFGEFGMPDADWADKVMHSMLETEGGLVLMGADNPPDAVYTRGTDVSLSLSGENAAELRGYWERLVEGGTVAVPLERQMWGDEFGMCTDRFGVTWLVNISDATS